MSKHIWRFLFCQRHKNLPLKGARGTCSNVRCYRGLYEKYPGPYQRSLFGYRCLRKNDRRDIQRFIRICVFASKIRVGTHVPRYHYMGVSILFAIQKGGAGMDRGTFHKAYDNNEHQKKYPAPPSRLNSYDANKIETAIQQNIAICVLTSKTRVEMHIAINRYLCCISLTAVAHRVPVLIKRRERKGVSNISCNSLQFPYNISCRRSRASVPELAGKKTNWGQAQKSANVLAFLLIES